MASTCLLCKLNRFICPSTSQGWSCPPPCIPPWLQATQSDLILQFREQGFHFFPLPLCQRKLWRVRQVPRALPGGFVLVDNKTPKGGTGAVWSLRASPTTFAGSDVGVGTVPMTSAAVVQWLACVTDITVALGLIREPLWTVERTVLSVDTVASPHIRSDAAVHQPLQELPISVCGIGSHRFWFSSLPLRETGEHVLRGDGFLAHARRRGLYSHNHAALIVHEIVVVIPQPSRRAALGGVGGIRIRGRDLILLMRRFFHRVLLFQFHQILANGVVDLSRFR